MSDPVADEIDYDLFAALYNTQGVGTGNGVHMRMIDTMTLERKVERYVDGEKHTYITTIEFVTRRERK
jgi:hypothetical protein